MRCLAGPRWVHRVQMVGHGTKFGRKKEQAITALLSHRSMEEAARAAGIGVNTLLRWMKEPEFDQAYRKARREAFGQGTARLQQASGAAVSSILKIMLDQHAPASTKLRAADLVLSHGAKAIEIEDIEARVAELERAAEEPKKTRGDRRSPNEALALDTTRKAGGDPGTQAGPHALLRLADDTSRRLRGRTAHRDRQARADRVAALSRVRVGGAAGSRTICPNGELHGGRQQAMTSLSRRLERLEAGCRQSFEIAPDRCRLIKQQALQHLTTDQLRCLIDLKKTPPQGRPLTSEESAVVIAFDTAAQVECRKAGITRAEFVRYNRQATQP